MISKCKGLIRNLNKYGEYSITSLLRNFQDVLLQSAFTLTQNTEAVITEGRRNV